MSLPALPRDVRSWLVTFIAVATMYLMVSRGFFFFNGVMQISVVCGVVAAMVAVNYLQAMLVGGGTLALLQFLLPPALVFYEKMTAANWLISMLFVLAVAFCVGYVRSRMADPRVFTLGITSVLVLWVIVNLWVPMLSSGFPPTAYGPLVANTIREVPQPGKYVNDDAIYRRLFYLMHDGQGYYRAYADSWLGLQQHIALPTSVTAYRLPTMYWLWRALPDDAFNIVIVFLAFASLGVIASAFIAGQIAGPAFAPLAATALAVYATSIAMSVYVTYIDLPAACIALVGIALFVRAEIKDDARFLWAAAAVLTLAILTREILAYLVVFAALSALLQPAGKRLRKATPWLVSLGVFALGYAAHAYQVLTLVRGRSTNLNYAGGSPQFALDAIRRFATVFTGNDLALMGLFLLGVAGAWAAHKRAGRPFAIFALAATLIPVLAMAKFGNPGIDAQGHQVNYWGTFVVPLPLALWPAALLLLPEL